MNQNQLISALEPLVDASSTSDVLLALARVCNEKAEHLRVNWQDAITARAWDTLARRIDKLSELTTL